ncbi:MAG: glycosyltransferase, partial [Candidatus Binatia bacterium]
QLYRVPDEEPIPLILGAPLGAALEAIAGSISVSAFGGESPPVERNALQMLGWCGVPWSSQRALAERCEVLPPPIDPEYFDAAPLERAPRTPFTFLAIAPAFARVDFATLVSAFEEAFGGSPDVRLAVIVTGPQPPPEVHAPNVDLRWDPWIDRARRATAYRTADTVILPGASEPWGLHFLEAVRCGVPVIAVRSEPLAALLEEDSFVSIGVGGLTRVPAYFHPYGMPCRPPDSASVAHALRAATSSAAKAPARAKRAIERLGTLGQPAEVLRRLSLSIEQNGTRAPDRFPAGHNPLPGPLVEPDGLSRALSLAGILRQGVLRGSGLLAEQMAARFTTHALGEMHARAEVQSLRSLVNARDSALDRPEVEGAPLASTGGEGGMHRELFRRGRRAMLRIIGGLKGAASS